MLLKVDKTLKILFLEYFEFADVFFFELVAEVSEHIRINNHVLNLGNSKNLLYQSIYNPELVELEVLKFYI